jgi:hypothetical protein
MRPVDPETASSLARTVRRIARGQRLTSLDVPLLEDAADALDAVLQTLQRFKDQLSVQEARTDTWHKACTAAEARVKQLEAALDELVAAGDFSITSTDDVAVMLRLGVATDTARAALAKKPTT